VTLRDRNKNHLQITVSIMVRRPIGFGISGSTIDPRKRPQKSCWVIGTQNREGSAEIALTGRRSEKGVKRRPAPKAQFNDAYEGEKDWSLKETRVVKGSGGTVGD